MRLKDIVIGGIYKNTIYVKPVEIIRTKTRPNILGSTVVRCLISKSKHGKYFQVKDFYADEFYE